MIFVVERIINLLCPFHFPSYCTSRVYLRIRKDENALRLFAIDEMKEREMENC